MSERIVVLSTGHVLAGEVRWARSYSERARGLLGRRPLAQGEGLVLDKTRQVHTFGMRYPIDVVFCSRDGTIVHVVRSLRPMRMTKWVRRGRYAIELPSGAAGDEVRVGEKVALQP